MAKYVNGNLTGRVRDVVYRQTKEFGVVVAEYNEGVYKNKKWTEGQSNARKKFRTLANLAGVFRQACNLGFGQGKKVLSQPLFIKYNYSSVYFDERNEIGIDYEGLCVSQGSLLKLDGLSFGVINGSLELSWKCDVKSSNRLKNSRLSNKGNGVGGGSDRIVVVLYCPTYGDMTAKNQCELFATKSVRTDGKASVRIPDKFRGKALYCYVFTSDDEHRASDTQFVGSFVWDEDLKYGERRFDLSFDDDGASGKTVFMGTEQREEKIGGEVKRRFVIKFSIDDEDVEEILEEPTEDADFVSTVENGIKRPSKAEQVCVRMKRLIRDVNPMFYNEKLKEGKDVEFDSWEALCSMVTDATNSCVGQVIDD